MRSALDYLTSQATDKLNRRVISLYYGVMAFAQAEMLAAPSGPHDLDEVEGMTKFGHVLWTLGIPGGGFADLQVGVLTNGFLSRWLNFLGYDTTRFPAAKAKSASDLENIPSDMHGTIRDLFAAMPEIEDLFSEVFGGAPGWIGLHFDSESNFGLHAFLDADDRPESTYSLLVDRSGLISIDRVRNAGWPIAEVQAIADNNAFRARVDHAGLGSWWNALPAHSSPFSSTPSLLFPNVGGIREYRAIAAVTLYALSIMTRYMPSAWRRIEGGDEDQYLALIKAALAVWERVLPEHFLESIAAELVATAQPGSWLA